MEKLITLFEEACAVKGLDPDKVIPDVSCYPEKDRAALVATAKLFIITDVLNEGHIFNWNDNNEEKWYPWFDMEVDDNNPSGFRLLGASYVLTCTLVGSRLCFRTRKLAEYAGKQFESLYRDLFVKK